jgi:hypothetical protein
LDIGAVLVLTNFIGLRIVDLLFPFFWDLSVLPLKIGCEGAN